MEAMLEWEHTTHTHTHTVVERSPRPIIIQKNIQQCKRVGFEWRRIFRILILWSAHTKSIYVNMTERFAFIVRKFNRMKRMQYLNWTFRSYCHRRHALSIHLFQSMSNAKCTGVQKQWKCWYESTFIGRAILCVWFGLQNAARSCIVFFFSYLYRVIQ